MYRSNLFDRMDCLDVLELMEDNSFSLIFVSIPSWISKSSKRIENTNVSLETLCKERDCDISELSDIEISKCMKVQENLKFRGYEKYLFKIVQNCVRILKRGGYIALLEGRPRVGNRYIDLKDLFDCYLERVDERVVEDKSGFFRWQNDYALLHIYTDDKRNEGIGTIYEWESEDEYPCIDEVGRYKLLPLEKESNNWNEFFVWNGMIPKMGNGWCFSKEEMDRILRNNLFVRDKGIPKYKCYRRCLPISSIWNTENVLERLFASLTKEKDEVLGVYESCKFASVADKWKLIWNSVYPADILLSWFDNPISVHKEIKNKYSIVKEIINPKELKYDVNRKLPMEYIREKNEYFRVFHKNEKISVPSGNTTDEILLHYFDEYTQQIPMSPSRFSEETGIGRQNIDNMRNAVRENREVIRTGDVIKRVAVHTHMSFEETRRALRASRLDFDNDLVDLAIMEWMINDNSSVNKLNDIIDMRCKEKGIPREIYDKYKFNIVSVNETEM